MRASKILGYILPLLALGIYAAAKPEVFSALWGARFVANAGSAEHPREFAVPIALVVIAPLALRFGLPLIFKGALLLPYAAAALSQRPWRRRAAFDPARDLPVDSIAPGSAQDVAVNRAIAAALAERGISAPPPPSDATGTPGASPAPLAGSFGHRDAAT